MMAASFRSGSGGVWLRPRRLAQIAAGLARQGPVGAAQLLGIYLVAPRAAALQWAWAPLWRDVMRRIAPKLVAQRIARLERRREAILETGRRGYRVATDALPLSDELRRALASGRSSGGELPLAIIDQDGFFVWTLGAIEGYPELPPDEALARRRTDITLVDLNGVAAVRKSYRGDRVSFANEVEALDELNRAGLRVPAILALDCRNLVVYESFIAGRVVREELARRGAPLRDRDRAAHAGLLGLPLPELRRRQIEEGRKRLASVMSSEQTAALADQVRRVHELGYLCLDVKYGNVVLESTSGLPYLIDFGDARRVAGLGRWGRAALRDAAVEALNGHFGTALTTRDRLQRRLRSGARDGVYAPVYFGAGLRRGGIWSDEAGYGRWLRLLDRHMPDVRGRRVLDIGANNAANALEMLRRGAIEVVAVELEERNIEQGRLVREGMEWADNRAYALRYVRGDMRDVPDMALGKFDMVTALCCLYYVDDEQMARLVRHFRSIAEVLVLQCNTARNIGRKNADVYRRASVEHNLSLLRDNGFSRWRVIAPPGYTRPLIIAHAGPDGAAAPDPAASRAPPAGGTSLA